MATNKDRWQLCPFIYVIWTAWKPISANGTESADHPKQLLGGVESDETGFVLNSSYYILNCNLKVNKV